MEKGTRLIVQSAFVLGAGSMAVFYAHNSLWSDPATARPRAIAEAQACAQSLPSVAPPEAKAVPPACNGYAVWGDYGFRGPEGDAQTYSLPSAAEFMRLSNADIQRQFSSSGDTLAWDIALAAGMLATGVATYICIEWNSWSPVTRRRPISSSTPRPARR